MTPRKPKIYIASPFTGAEIQNIARAVEAADEVLSLGCVPFLPHTMTGFWHMLYHRTYQEWMAFDLEWLSVCDAIFVVDDNSSGVRVEIEYCLDHNIPVLRSMDELKQFLSTPWRKDHG